MSEKGEVRHSELSKVIPSRGTLSLTLRDAEQEGLISRRVVNSKPPASYYSLTVKGRRVSSLLKEIREAV